MYQLQILFTCLLLVTYSIGHGQNIPFQEKAEDYGISYSFFPDLNSDYGMGITFFDINEDGFDDILFGGLQEEKTHLYIFNDSLNSFDKIFLEGINNIGYRSKCLLWVDYDNDGDKDLSLTNIFGPARLYENDGNFNFSESTTFAGIDTTEMNSYASCWGDYNKDGFLDWYIINRLSPVSDNRNALYKNNGDGTFENVTEEAGVLDEQGLGLAVSFMDYDLDGWPDIYVANDKAYSANVLYRNLGNGSFENVSDSLTTGLAIDAMGLAIADYDKNGHEDIYMTNNPQSSVDYGGNALLYNNGDGSFTDVSDDLGVKVYSLCWGTSTGDFNNDSHHDIFVSTDGFSETTKRDRLFLNRGDGTFNQDTLNDIHTDYKRSFGNAIGDFNNDGFSDIVVMNVRGEKVSLFENGGNENNWVKINLEGSTSNKDGVGSWIKTYFDNDYTELYTRCGTSYGSQSSNNYAIGLGSAERVDSMIVTWPSGIVDTHYYLSPNKTYYFTEGIQFIDSSMVDTVTIDSTTTHAHTNSLNKKLFSIYPNPTSSQVIIKANQSTRLSSIEIMNALGEIIYQNDYSQKPIPTQISIPLNQFPLGNYFIKIECNDGVFLEKVVKVE